MTTPSRRLWLLAALIVLSAVDAGIVQILQKDAALAYALALGYIAILLTILVYLHVIGRKHG